MRPEEVAEVIFDALNIGDYLDYGTINERAVAYRLARMRSLSFGNVLEIDCRYLAVASIGFTTVDKPARMRGGSMRGVLSALSESWGARR